MNKTCKNCKYFYGANITFVGHDTCPENPDIVRTHIRSVQTACRRHAPITTNGNAFGLTEMNWPYVSETDYCGDWEGKDV